MENLVWATMLWVLVLLLVPLERIKQLWPVAVITMLWFFSVNYFFINWGYYRFTHIIISFLGVPLIQNLGGAAGGILLMNWMRPSPLIKIFIVVLAAAFFNLSEYVFRLFGAFVYGNGFNPLLSFILHLAMISILVWLCLAVVGEEKIYNSQRKTRFIR
ncbi:MAG: hypothetical protein ACOY46_05900 [Bacillota bacterium]